MLSRFIILVLGSAFLSTAHANDQIVTLKKNDPAPFSGTLFSTSAAARVAIELENSETTCGLKIGEAVEKQKAYDQFQLDLKQNQIDSLTEQLKKNTGPQPAWWFAGGVVGGIVVSLATAYAYSQISTAN